MGGLKFDIDGRGREVLAIRENTPLEAGATREHSPCMIPSITGHNGLAGTYLTTMIHRLAGIGSYSFKDTIRG